MFNEAGVPITLASDAHEPAHCGRDASTLVRAVRAAGYGEHIAFDQRVAFSKALPD
jgi:histidinol phosphatase-like PHP family hydrolase